MPEVPLYNPLNVPGYQPIYHASGGTTPPAADGTTPDVAFSVSPSLRSAAPNAATGAYVVTLLDASGLETTAPMGGQLFLLSDGGSGGVFSPASITIAAGYGTASFTYSNATPGVYALGVAPSGGTLSALSPLTVSAVITSSGAGSGGGSRMTSNNAAAVIGGNGKIFGEGYLFAKNSTWDDTPFATIEDLTIKDDITFTELMGPEQLTALAVGAKERKVTLEASFATFKLEQLLLARAGSISTVAAVLAPATAPTLTAAAGTTNYTAGYIAVGYTWQTPYGDTVVSPLTTIAVTATQQITVTSLAAALAAAGGASVNYFMSSASYATAAALAAPLYAAGNTAGGATILPNYPVPPARTAPLVSSISTARRVLQFGTADTPTPCLMHFQTPAGGLDLELFAYNCVIPSLEIPLKNREFTVNKIGINAYGDPTVNNGAVWEVLTV